MKRIRNAPPPTICCHHETLDYNEDGELIGTCARCGQVKKYDPEGGQPPVIVKEGSMTKTITPDAAGTLPQRHAYYELHREELLADIRAIGSVATRKKWSIPPTTLYQLRTKWLGVQPPAAEKSRQAGQPAQSSLHQPPTLPPFNEAWPPEVKVAWLMSTVMSTVVSALMSTGKEAAWPPQ